MARADEGGQAAQDVWPITLTVLMVWLLLNRLLAELLVRLELDFGSPVVGPLA
ncbi:MAG TPA: hypothetical protein VF198_07270 [Vicinamibacterales bacterium]